MSYESIPGTRNLFINEQGSVRYMFKEIPLNYARKDGHVDTDQWPTVAAEVDGQTQELLLPEVLLSVHGNLPPGDYDPDDFEASSGDRTDLSIENVSLEGTGSPYSEEPDDEDKQTEQPDLPDEPDVDEEIDRDVSVAEEVQKENDIDVTSDELTAKEAIDVIESHDLQTLKDAGFMSEDSRPSPRVTVQKAWNKKTNQ